MNMKKLRRKDRKIKLKLHSFLIMIKLKKILLCMLYQCYIYSNAPVGVVVKYL